MIRLRSLAALFLIGSIAPVFADPTATAPFAAGDRWAVLGDSITHSGTYHTWVLMYYVTRFPDHKIDAFNCGISGDSAAGALQRVQWDVLINHPTVVSIMLGMNDVGRPLYATNTPPSQANEDARKARIDGYKKSMADLVDVIQSSGAKVILIQPSPFDETVDLPIDKETGVNEAIGDCAQYLTQLASDTGASVVDFYDPMNAVTKLVQANDPKATIIGKDRIHPGAPGHFLMAYTFLKAQGVSAEVAHAIIDAPRKRVQDSGNSTVSDVKIIKGGVTFTWDERALPYPIDESVKPALAWVPFVQDMNQETLTVLGLNAGATYQLSIDGTPLRTYTAEELGRGVNLATETQTPQYQQAMSVSRLILDRSQMVAEKIRGLALIEEKAAPKIEHPVTPEQMEPFVKAWVAKQGPNINGSYKVAAENYAERKSKESDLVAQAAALLDQAYALATPRPHAYKIVLIR